MAWIFWWMLQIPYYHLQQPCKFQEVYIHYTRYLYAMYNSVRYVLVGSVSLQNWQNCAFYDRAFKLGGDVLWTNRNDLRYGAKKYLQWTYENLHNVCITRKFSFFTTSWTLSNIFIAYLLAIGGHWRLLIANIVQFALFKDIRSMYYWC